MCVCVCVCVCVGRVRGGGGGMAGGLNMRVMRDEWVMLHKINSSLRLAPREI